MIPSPRDLSIFVEAAQKGNLSRAAEALGMAQPSLSLAIARLERNLGEQVFIRSKTGVTLTQAGKQLLVHAKELLQSWESIRHSSRASHTEVQGSFVLGCHSSVGAYTLPQALPQLLEHHPKLNITLVHDLSRRITEAVVSSRIDVGIVVNPIRHPDLAIQHMAHDNVTLWCSSNSKTKTKMQSIASSDVYLHPDLAQTQQLLRALSRKGIHPRRTIESTSLELIAKLAAQGSGIAILPSRVAAFEGTCLKALDGAPYVRDSIACITHAATRKVQAIKAITSAIKNSFAHQPTT